MSVPGPALFICGPVAFPQLHATTCIYYLPRSLSTATCGHRSHAETVRYTQPPVSTPQPFNSPQQPPATPQPRRNRPQPRSHPAPPQLHATTCIYPAALNSPQQPSAATCNPAAPQKPSATRNHLYLPRSPSTALSSHLQPRSPAETVRSPAATQPLRSYTQPPVSTPQPFNSHLQPRSPAAIPQLHAPLVSTCRPSTALNGHLRPPAATQKPSATTQPPAPPQLHATICIYPQPQQPSPATCGHAATPQLHATICIYPQPCSCYLQPRSHAETVRSHAATQPPVSTRSPSTTLNGPQQPSPATCGPTVRRSQPAHKPAFICASLPHLSPSLPLPPDPACETARQKTSRPCGREVPPTYKYVKCLRV